VADIVDEAYGQSDADSSSGQGQRVDDSTYPNGLLRASSVRSVPNVRARSPLTDAGESIGPSGDNAADVDEGVDVAGPDDPLPSYEMAQAATGRSAGESAHQQEWSFARVSAGRKDASEEDSMTAASDVAAPPDSDHEDSLQPLISDNHPLLRRRHASRSSMVSDASMLDSEQQQHHEQMGTVEMSYDEEQPEEDSVMEIRTEEDM